MMLDRWLAALPGDGPSGGTGASRAAGEDLLRRWEQPHRHYHTVRHLAAVLDVVDTHAGWADDPDAVLLAAWFHDAVYDPRTDDNEAASAALAGRVLPGLGVTPDRVAEVERLVLLTAGHDPAPGDRPGELLCDADLAILAAPPDRYARYAAAVRREYAHVPDAAFRAGRAAVLRRLLALPRLYHVAEVADGWDAAARANLTAELSTLEGAAR